MDDPQTASVFFLLPVATAYLTVCGLWLLYDWKAKLRRDEPPLALSDHPYWDLLLTVAAAAGIFLLGGAYRAGWLLPTGSTSWGRLAWIADNLIIYSPIAAVLLVRRQGPETVFLTPVRLPEKIALGLALGVVAVATYCLLRGEGDRIPQYLADAVAFDTLADFVPVFLEGVAVAFAFVRLRWLVGTAAAVAIPSLLFAAGHVPGQIEAGRDAWHMTVFFAFNSALPAAIFGTVQRARDVIWIGLVHYLMDIAIHAI